MTFYKLFLAYFNKLYREKLIKKGSKQFIRKTKIDYLNDKNVLLKNKEKNIKQLSIK